MADIEANYISGASKQILVVEYRARAPGRGTIVYVPPFGEEMNKARTMTSLQARRMADAGFRVLVPDLSGTGDSYGDFSESTWEHWKDDIRGVIESFNIATETEFWLWGLRLGVPLALETVEAYDIQPAGLLGWAPVQNGNLFFNQLLRMRSMASMLSGAETKESTSDLRSMLDSEGEIEIGGYTIGHSLASSIQELNLQAIAMQARVPIYWFEMISDEEAVKSPVTLGCAKELEAAGVCRQLEWIVGPDFWSTAETSASDELIERTRSTVE